MFRKVRLRAWSSAGVSCPLPEVTVGVWTRYGDYTPMRFLIDTGADLSALPVFLARQEGIPFEQTEATHGRVIGLTGAADRYRGVLQVRLGGQRFHWPCLFIDSATSSASRPQPRGPYGVLGRAGFFSDFAVCADDRFVTIRHRWVSRPWWYRLARRLAAPFPREHPADEPL